MHIPATRSGAAGMMLAFVRLVPILFVLGTLQLAACRDSITSVGCCKICAVGKKPCGDECILAVQTCNSPRGCACAG
jgi:hypothetical protein